MKMLVEDIREKFLIKTIPNIIGEPSYKAINDLRGALYENASAIPKTLGGGRGKMATLAYSWKHQSMIM